MYKGSHNKLKNIKSVPSSKMNIALREEENDKDNYAIFSDGRPTSYNGWYSW